MKILQFPSKLQTQQFPSCTYACLVIYGSHPSFWKWLSNPITLDRCAAWKFRSILFFVPTSWWRCFLNRSCSETSLVSPWSPTSQRWYFTHTHTPNIRKNIHTFSPKKETKNRLRFRRPFKNMEPQKSWKIGVQAQFTKKVVATCAQAVPAVREGFSEGEGS